MVALQNEQLPLALVGGIQKFFDFVKALVGCRLFHEHVHNGVPPEVFNKALDGQDGIAQCSRPSRQRIWKPFTFGPIAILSVRSRGGSSGVAKRRRVPPLSAKSAAKGIVVVAACSY